MKIIKEEFKNFPAEEATTVITPAEAQAVKDEKEFDKRKKETEDSIKTKLPVNGMKKAETPKQEVFPKSALKESFEDSDSWDEEKLEDLLVVLRDINDLNHELSYCIEGRNTGCQNYSELAEYVKKLVQKLQVAANKLPRLDECLATSLNENINEEDAARIVLETIKHNFGVDVDVATYKDAENSKCVIVEFIASKEDCQRMPYDELKEALYKRFGNDINISSKQFSSPNLKNKGTEYKLKLFVLKEKKDKSKIYAENLVEKKENK